MKLLAVAVLCPIKKPLKSITLEQNSTKQQIKATTAKIKDKQTTER